MMFFQQHARLISRKLRYCRLKDEHLGCKVGMYICAKMMESLDKNGLFKSFTRHYKRPNIKNRIVECNKILVDSFVLQDCLALWK